jgi:hypothetical protein
LRLGIIGMSMSYLSMRVDFSLAAIMRMRLGLRYRLYKDWCGRWLHVHRCRLRLGVSGMSMSNLTMRVDFVLAMIMRMRLGLRLNINRLRRGSHRSSRREPFFSGLIYFDSFHVLSIASIISLAWTSLPFATTKVGVNAAESICDC